VPYIKQTWANDVAGGTKLNATRMNYIEAGIETAQATAEQALSAATGQPGVVQIESFSGANDAAKVTAAFSYAAAQTNIPWLQTPYRTLNTGTSTFNMFTGLKVMGPGSPVGPKNLEISGGKPVVAKWQTSCGNGASSLFQATATTYDVIFSNIAFQAGGSTSQAFRSTVNLYACEFNALTFYGFKHAFGSTAEKFLTTQCRFTGHWQVLSQWDCQFHIGGSDNDFWKSGYINIGGGGATAGGGLFLIDLDGVGKTNVGWVYATCNNGWRGLRVRSAGSNGVQLDGGAYEGMNAATPCDGNVIRVDGGIVSIRDCWTAYAMNAPGGTEHGVIEVANAAEVLVDGVKYGRGTAPEATPLVYFGDTSEGYVRSCMPDKANATWTGRPRVQDASTGTILVTDASVTLI
jgi:hypothetical protein